MQHFACSREGARKASLKQTKIIASKSRIKVHKFQLNDIKMHKYSQVRKEQRDPIGSFFKCFRLLLYGRMAPFDQTLKKSNQFKWRFWAII